MRLRPGVWCQSELRKSEGQTTQRKYAKFTLGHSASSPYHKHPLHAKTRLPLPPPLLLLPLLRPRRRRCPHGRHRPTQPAHRPTSPQAQTRDSRCTSKCQCCSGARETMVRGLVDFTKGLAVHAAERACIHRWCRGGSGEGVEDVDVWEAGCGEGHALVAAR